MTAVDSTPLRERILQRLPIISHLFVLPFAIWGPALAPVCFAVFNAIVHCMVLGVNLRTIYGTFRAWRGVKKHSETDWRAEYVSKRAGLAQDADVLDYEDVQHLVIVPNYEEDITVLRETLYLLSTHPDARQYHPVLAMEARERGARTKAELLMNEYGGSFGSLSYTLHPSGIEGEAAGKSSNLSWAIRQAWYSLTERDPRIEAKTVVTVIDSDTALAGDYFSAVTCHYALRNADERTRMTFVPPIVFDRNAHEVPVTVRLVDMMWAMAGLSTIYPESTVKIPTSAYSLALTLASSTGFHDAGPAAIGEDMHEHIKLLFCTAGNVISTTVYSPASQLDVCAADSTGFVGMYNDHIARYKQAVRHLWGSLDSGYCADRLWRRAFGPCEQDFESAHRQGAPVGVFTLEDKTQLDESTLHAPAWIDTVASGPQTPVSGLSTPLETICEEEASSVSSFGLNDGDEKALMSFPRREKIKVMPFVVLIMRLYEAHLLIGHMTILSVVRVLKEIPHYVWESPVQLVPLPVASGSAIFVSYSKTLASYLGPLFFFTTIGMIIVFDRYHQQAALHRWQFADRLGAQPSARSYRPFPRAVFDVLALPGGILFGVIPAFHAQIMHLITIKLKYTVSFKPTVKGLPRPATSARDVEKSIV
ncbi:uncharacterized protein LOC62_06G008207 [Vanrija pseudolonga]|uniref:Glycosyltransferase 2-like domain-containing protein n=1 Tax=Vanrija pseudolonga TaxID=143232 RepID=A0AAF1BNS0_9TREE|nr:hypothetical protein LOC62_06G008207 [Vanrija pseudolonga]